MTDNPRVEELLEELLDSGGTPEEVCRECPEMLPDVRAGWERVRALKAEVGALFPEPTWLNGAAPDGAPRADMTNLPCIRGHEVQQVLGHGGMGVVYKAWHLQLNRPVAVKMLLAGAYARPEELERFLLEAEAVAGLSHANIVQVHEIGDVDGRPYFTMDFVEGGNLAQKLAGAPLPAGQAAALLATLADAVQIAHQSGIVHRDLKPANILLTDEGMPKITDFGLARRLEDSGGLTLTGSPLGTPSYMAPEQALGKNDAIGPGTDVYALGAILYECLTGRPPFNAESAAETHHQVIFQDPASPRLLNPKIPRDLETICLKCLRKEPERRYVSAAALADDLRRFGEGRPIQARPVGWAERLWRWGRRNPTAAALLATALAFVGLASGGGGWLVYQHGERQAEAAQRDRELRTDVGAAVAQSVSLRRGFHFKESQELLDQARQRLELAAPDDLRRQVEQAQTDLNSATRLDDARIKTSLAAGTESLAAVEPLYESAFAEMGLGREGGDVQAAAARVRDSALSAELIAALDDWASITTNPKRREWLLTVACDADRNPARNRLRRVELWNDPDLWKDVERLKQLTEDLKAADLSPQLAIAVARAANESRVDVEPLLIAVQVRHPENYWLNVALGATMSEAENWNEAVGYYRAALAVRPKLSAVQNNLSIALYAAGRHDEAIGHFEQALRLTPKSIAAQVNLGRAFYDRQRADDALQGLYKNMAGNTESFEVHFNLGTTLEAKGRLDGAIPQLQQAVRENPKSAAAHTNLGIALREKGDMEEAIGHFEQAVRLNPKSAAAHINLGTTLYASARVTVRAAAGANPNTKPLELAAQRQQALVRLRACLELANKLLDDGRMSPNAVNAWQLDPALKSVRNAFLLKKVPEAERVQWERFWAEVSDAGLDPVRAGGRSAVAGDWGKAAKYFTRGLTHYYPTDDGHFWFEYAAVLLLSGDRAGYEKACTHMVDACGKAKGPRPYHTARACTLAPDTVADLARMARLAESELQKSKEFWSLTEQGALAYRTGQFQEAVPLFEQSLRANPKPGAAVLNWLWLALAHQRLGKTEEARHWLGKAQAWLDKYGDGMPPRAEQDLGLHLHNWLEAHVLRREAEALLKHGEQGAPPK
jgi:tetratricopeptide (TPR) repeat protein